MACIHTDKHTDALTKRKQIILGFAAQVMSLALKPRRTWTKGLFACGVSRKVINLVEILDRVRIPVKAAMSMARLGGFVGRCEEERKGIRS